MTLNSVVTAQVRASEPLIDCFQYFVWYFAFWPLALGLGKRIRWKKLICLSLLWLAAEGHWVYWSYQFEYCGSSHGFIGVRYKLRLYASDVHRYVDVFRCKYPAGFAHSKYSSAAWSEAKLARYCTQFLHATIRWPRNVRHRIMTTSDYQRREIRVYVKLLA